MEPKTGGRCSRESVIVSEVLPDGPLVPYRTGVMSEQNATLTWGETNNSEAPGHSGIHSRCRVTGVSWGNASHRMGGLAEG
jgi:hypothetical protein